MSFSSEVKEELFDHIGKSRHCQLAELAALISWEGEHSLLDEKKYEIYRASSKSFASIILGSLGQQQT